MTDKITETRTALHTMLTAALPDVQGRRVHAYPQFGGAVPPCAWVGLATVTDQGRGATLEVPLVLAADGKVEHQVAWLDQATAAVWDGVRTVEAAGGKAQATSSSQDQLGPDGSTTVALTITVRVPLGVRTLCPQTAQLDQS